MNIKVSKRLYRSRKERQLAGVCGGVADYLGVDPTLVRLLWVIFAIAGGPGVLLYLIMAAVVPEEPEFVRASAEKGKNEDVV
ncbi:MAG: PspC domain-containing protein [Chloroflexi bacterium]|nr:PspC domain-containing protein [Chloroflexota bacterium]